MRLFMLLPLLAATCAHGQQFDVKTHMLANGMKLLIHEKHDIPNAALYFFFKVGSRNERPGATGISHFFEHMMFNGAKKYGPKQFDIAMERAGGSNNAYTSRDITAYTDWFPRTALELIFELEADRIRDLAFDPKIVESERGVIASERRMGVENSNAGLLEEQLNAAAYTAHPYGWPVVGWASDIEGWTMDDLKTHFRMGYSPNNCVVVAVGDVSTEEVIALARKHLEPIPSHEPPPPVRTREPGQMGERRVEVRKFAQLPLQMFSFHVPESKSADFPTLEVLGSILTSGRSSRLYRRLVDRDQLALDVGHSLGFSMDPGQLTFDLRPRSGVAPAAAEKAFLEELDRVAASGVTATEVEKAKNQLLTEFYSGLQTIAGIANSLGRYEVFLGDYRRLFTYDKEIEKVTPTAVQAAAKKYLASRNRTVATLIPESREAAQ